jgi:hypothetical protein
MKEFGIFYNPWGNQTDFFIDILEFIMLVYLIYIIVLYLSDKINYVKVTHVGAPLSAVIINCIAIFTVNWYFAIPIIVLFSLLLWFAYSAEINFYVRLQIKNIQFYDRYQAREDEDEYDSAHTKEELEIIKRDAHKYPRMGITKFFIISFVIPIMFFIFLLLMGYKYIP